MQKLCFYLSLVFSILAVSCGGGSTSSSAPANPVVNITVSPSIGSAQIDVPFQMNVKVTYSSGATGSSAEWSVAPIQGSASISQSGLLTCDTNGIVSVTASAGNLMGGSQMACFGNVTAINVSPITGSASVGSSFPFHAFAEIQGMEAPVDISNVATWSTQPSSAISFTQGVDPASATCNSAGVYTIEAAYESSGETLTASAQLTCN